MREHRALPSRKHRRHQSSSPAERSITNGINALMDAVQSPPRDPPSHRAFVDPELTKLIQCHHAVLPGCKLINVRIDASPSTGRFRSVGVLF